MHGRGNERRVLHPCRSRDLRDGDHPVARPAAPTPAGVTWTEAGVRAGLFKVGQALAATSHLTRGLPSFGKWATDNVLTDAGGGARGPPPGVGGSGRGRGLVRHAGRDRDRQVVQRARLVHRRRGRQDRPRSDECLPVRQQRHPVLAIRDQVPPARQHPALHRPRRATHRVPRPRAEGQREGAHPRDDSLDVRCREDDEHRGRGDPAHRGDHPLHRREGLRQRALQQHRARTAPDLPELHAGRQAGYRLPAAPRRREDDAADRDGGVVRQHVQGFGEARPRRGEGHPQACARSA